MKGLERPIRNAAVVLGIVFCAWCAYSQEPATPAGSQDAPGPLVSIDINGAEPAEAMSQLSEATGFSVMISSKVSGKFSAFIRDMNPEQALAETCKVNGLEYVKNGNVVWVLTHDEYIQDFNLGRERRVIPLKYARAADVAATLSAKGLLSKDALALAYPETNALVLAEQTDRVAAVVLLVEQLDQPRSTRVLPLQYAAAGDVLPLVQGYASAPSAVQADPRTNQLLVTETEDNLARIEELIRQFDQPDRMQTRVFVLRYAQSDEIASLLREVLTGQKSTSTSNSPEVAPQTRSKTTQPISGPPSTEGRARAAQPVEAASAAPRAASPSANNPGPVSGTTNAPVSAAQPAAAAPLAQDATANTSEGALGPLSTVVSDPRTNSVIVTHIASVLDRLAQIIESVDVPSDLHVFQFQNADPAELEVEMKLAALLPREDAYVSVDKVGRKVTFRASPEQAEEILSLMRRWDEAVRQVHIEAEILAVNSTLIRQLGVKWKAVLDKTDGGLRYDRAEAQINFAPAVGDAANQARLSIGNLEYADYNALIQALTTDNDTHMIASPKILVRDGQEAAFSSTRDEPYTVVTVNGETNTTLQDVRFLPVGTTLRVAPTINTEGLIGLRVQLELSNLIEIRGGTPVVDRSTAESMVSVRDGGTVILGGLRQRTRKEGEQGVPGLRKVPVVGRLFKTNEDTRTEQEIILILRPMVTGANVGSSPSIVGMQQELDQRATERRLGVTQEKRKE